MYYNHQTVEIRLAYIKHFINIKVNLLVGKLRKM